MKNRSVYIFSITALVIALVAQYYWLQNIPAPDQDLIRHEASHYRMVNLFERNSFYSTFDRLEKYAKHRSRPKTKSAYEAAIRTKESLKVVLAHLHQNNDSALEEAVAIHDRELALVRPHTEREYEFNVLEAGALDEAFPMLDLCRRESHILQNYVLAMDLYYDACCDAISDRFYSPEILMSPIGYKHFPDTIAVFMPSVVMSGATERIEITANKKYFDKLIDSLKNAGVIAPDRRPFYKAIVRLKNDDLGIAKLNSSRQVISELDHTTWRFDVSASEKGVKEIEGEIGVVVLDADDKEEVFYVPWKVGAVRIF